MQVVMATRYKPPSTEETMRLMGARMPVERFADLAQVVEDWRNVAIASGEPKEVVESITQSHVLRRALETFFDAELAEFGGRPTTDEQRAARKAIISKKFHSKK